jgi:hypothetical protein
MRKHLAIVGTILALSACSGNDTGMQDTGMGAGAGTPPATAMPGTDTGMGAGGIPGDTTALQTDTLRDTTGGMTTGTDTGGTTGGTTPPPR